MTDKFRRNLNPPPFVVRPEGTAAKVEDPTWRKNATFGVAIAAVVIQAVALGYLAYSVHEMVPVVKYEVSELTIKEQESTIAEQATAIKTGQQQIRQQKESLAQGRVELEQMQARVGDLMEVTSQLRFEVETERKKYASAKWQYFIHDLRTESEFQNDSYLTSPALWLSDSLGRRSFSAELDPYWQLGEALFDMPLESPHPKEYIRYARDYVDGRRRELQSGCPAFGRGGDLIKEFRLKYSELSVEVEQLRLNQEYKNRVNEAVNACEELRLEAVYDLDSELRDLAMAAFLQSLGKGDDGF